MSRVTSTRPDIACSGPMQVSLVLQAMSERHFQSTGNSATSCQAAHLHGGDLAWQGFRWRGSHSFWHKSKVAAHHFLRRPPKVRLHGKAGMSHGLLGTLGSASWVGVPCCIQGWVARVSGVLGSRDKVWVHGLVLPPWQYQVPAC